MSNKLTPTEIEADLNAALSRALDHRLKRQKGDYEKLAPLWEGLKKNAV